MSSNQRRKQAAQLFNELLVLRRKRFELMGEVYAKSGRLLRPMLLSDDLKMAKDEIEHEIELIQNILDSDLCKPRKRVVILPGSTPVI